jgi:predicted nucleic acid-binding protein
VKVFVIDASVSAKWVLPGVDEPLRAEALQLLLEWTKGQIQLVVPDFFWTETANVLRKAIRCNRCSKETAERAMAILRDLKIPTVPSLPLLDSAFEKAVAYGRPVYDGLYLALAVESKAQFVTADENLANALAAYLPLKWLGAI